MDNAETSAVERELARLLRLPPRERDAALEELRGRAPAVAAEVDRWADWLADRGLAGGDDLLPDRLGDFKLLRRIGGGGMGLVYVAEQESLDREVALKILRPEQMLVEGGRERFLREARAIAALDHPNIVPVHAVDEHRGIPYLVMELVDGRSASEVIDALAAAGGDVPEPLHAYDFVTGGGNEAPALYRGSWPDFCTRVAAECANAIVAAHGAGITHRDVKPSNLMLTRDGRVLARAHRGDARRGTSRARRRLVLRRDVAVHRSTHGVRAGAREPGAVRARTAVPERGAQGADRANRRRPQRGPLPPPAGDVPEEPDRGHAPP